MSGAVWGQMAFREEMWVVGSHRWPGYTQIYPDVSVPFQESDLESINDQKTLALFEWKVVFILTNIC